MHSWISQILSPWMIKGQIKRPANRSMVAGSLRYIETLLHTAFFGISSASKGTYSGPLYPF